MKVVKRVAEKAMEKKYNYLPTNETIHEAIILTSESSKVLQSRFEFEQNDEFPFRFIVNENDVTQGTGNPNKYRKGKASNITADDIMLSTVMAIKMQLHSQSTILNCCSNFHKLILSFLRRGCGAAKINHFECLQDNENPKYRLCCHFGKKSCKSKKEKLKLVK